MHHQDSVIKPVRPRSGAHVGLVTPSSSIAPFPRRRERALAALTEFGFVPRLAPRALWRDTDKPTPQQLADDLHWCVTEPGIELVLCTTGGATSAELLPHLDFDSIAASRRPLCGFSDITSLLLGVHARTGLVTLHGPTLLPSFGDADGVDPYTEQSLRSALSSTGYPRALVAPPETSIESPTWERDDHRPRRSRRAGKWSLLVPGSATGRLVGGHLGTLCELLPTRFFPPTTSRVVFLETNATSFTQSLRELRVLTDAGTFDRARAIVFGRVPTDEPPAALHKELVRIARDREIPLLVDVDLGHTVPTVTLPVGVLATVDAHGLHLIESAVVEPTTSSPPP